MLRFLIICYGIFWLVEGLIAFGSFIYHLFHGKVSIGQLFIILLMAIILVVWGLGLIRRLGYARILSIVINILFGLYGLLQIAFPKIYIYGSGRVTTEYQAGILIGMLFWSSMLGFVIAFVFTRRKIKEQFK